MNILQLSLLLAILLKCITASESGVAQDVIDALSESEKQKGFESIKRNFWEKWQHRDELFDEVVARGSEFIINFINQDPYSGEWTGRTLAALFIKNPDAVDAVFKVFKRNDQHLPELIRYRSDLAELPDKFFNVIGRIENSEIQKEAVGLGIDVLLYAGKYDFCYSFDKCS